MLTNCDVSVTLVATAIPPPNSRTPVLSDTIKASSTEGAFLRRFKSSGMWRSVVEWTYPDIRQMAEPASLGSNMARYHVLLQPEDEGNTILRNVSKYLTIDRMLTSHKIWNIEQRSCEKVKSGRVHAVYIYMFNATSQIIPAGCTLHSLKSNQFIILRPTGLILLILRKNRIINVGINDILALK